MMNIIPWIIELGEILREQGVKFTDYIDVWKRSLNKWTLETHVVNLAMMLKYEALCSKFFGEPYENIAEELWSTLVEYNGTVVGTLTGDECLSGLKNNQGTELCSVVELMYSFEVLYSITKDPVWAERLEKVAFNALPATISDDMWTHQYDQQVNQIACMAFPGKSYFRTNGPESHLFGLEPHFVNRPMGLKTAEYGPLVFSLPIETNSDGITVEFTPIPSGDYETKVTNALRGRNVPDVIVAGDGEIKSWIEKGGIATLDDYVAESEELDLEAMWPDAVNRYRYDDFADYLFRNGYGICWSIAELC